MTTEQKARAYDKALERARLLKLANPDDVVIQTFVKDSFPELKESEDERIRKGIISGMKALQEKGKYTFANIPMDNVFAWLEKQKDAIPNAKYIEDVAHAFEDGRRKSEEKQEEQKPEEWSEDDKFKLEDAITGIDVGIGFYEREGKHPNLLKAIVEAKEWLKSLRPQPHKETYQAAKHDLAIKFMNYLDENCPEGKMCLSNGECEDIDKAFKENDWAKIIRYAEKYQIQKEQLHWKPSKEQMKALSETIAFAPDTFKPKCTLVTLQNDLKKLMEE